MKTGGPAFPWANKWNAVDGMSLRDYFAAHAPMLPNWWLEHLSIDDAPAEIAKWCFAYADAMLAAREKQNG